MSAYEAYLAHQKQATINPAGVLSAVAGGAQLPLGAYDLGGMAASGLKRLGKFTTNVGGPRAGGIREMLGKQLNNAGNKVQGASKALGDMSHKILNYGGKGIAYDPKKLPGIGFDQADRESKHLLTPQRGAYWAGNAIGLGEIAHSVTSAIAPTPPNAVKTAQIDFGNMVRAAENNQ